MIELFNAILYQPLFNFLIWLYNILPRHDIGLAIIILTVLIKLILYPFSLQALRAQKALAELQPKIEELKTKYKDRKDLMTQEMMKLYQDNKVNPLSSCLPILIQLPFLIAVYQVFIKGLGSQGLENLYPFVANPGHINAISMGFLDLAKPNLILAILAGAAQFWQAKMMPRQGPSKNHVPGSRDESVTAMMNKQMLYFMPIITVLIGASLPGGLTFYWFLTTLLSVGQQYLYFRKRKQETADGKETAASN